MSKYSPPKEFTADRGQDTDVSNADSEVRDAVREASRSQGGTMFTDPYVGCDKGNEDPIDMEVSERVNSDPQSFGWNDRPRDDMDNHNHNSHNGMHPYSY